MEKEQTVLIIGGGLSGLLTAWRCVVQNKNLNVTIIEQSSKLGGDHTWSFNRSDICPEHQVWIEPLIAYEWPQYQVRFPKRNRVLDIPYCTTNSPTLMRCIEPYISAGRINTRLNISVSEFDANHVILTDGQTLEADCVLDARGFGANQNVFLAYQKFVGHTIQTKTPHGLQVPIIMDATVEQFGGYRFIYCLPFSETEILVEDTYYADDDELKAIDIDNRIKAYIANNLKISDYSLQRRETGVLPITLAVDKDYGTDTTDDGLSAVELGLRAGYYHAVTGYSFPEAVRSAVLVADLIKQNWPDFQKPLRHEMIFHKRDHFFEEKFLRLLNRMLFRAAKAEVRYKVLERFYGLRKGLIERFYQNRLTKLDKIRILSGKPPVPVTKALYNFDEKAFIKRERN